MQHDVEIWINVPQYDFREDGGVRRLTPEEVHQRALERLPGSLAWELNIIGQEARVTRALESDPELAVALIPRSLDDKRYGIVFRHEQRERLREAVARMQ